MIHNDYLQRPETYSDPYTQINCYSPSSSRSQIIRNSLLVPDAYRQSSDDSGNESSTHYQSKSKIPNAHFVVVAIDFGTTYSGYAFAFTRDPDSILMMRKVDGNDPGQSMKRCEFILTDHCSFSFPSHWHSNRCNQPEDTYNNSINAESWISFVRFFCSWFLPWSWSWWSQTLALFRKI